MAAYFSPLNIKIYITINLLDIKHIFNALDLRLTKPNNNGHGRKINC